MKRLLLIEDDPNTREGLADLLRLDGHVVQAAGNGRSGLELAGAVAFDAMLCDYKLPDMNGLEVCRRLHKLHRPLMLFLLTAYNNAEINHAAKDCGVAKIFYKPIDLDELFATLVSFNTPRAGEEQSLAND
jgi:CheY-like chemotaxis protein